ncbi:MAG TPA: pyrimidine 5'-nucleotidase [Rhodospirillales bacterium]|nr:pyrimidine 5'-nucleotidase [Rhodospirillales bacterium]
MDYSELRSAETWIFDLDNTLYDASSNLFAQISARMTDFIADLLALDRRSAFDLQKKYFHKYGTTLRGLMQCHQIDPHVFLDRVHDIDLGVIDQDPALDAALSGLDGHKVIFTNGSNHHASRIIGRLGIAEHFSAIFDIVDAGFVPKPAPEVYRHLIDRLDIQASRAVMVEDMACNLKPAADLGMTTVWVRTQTDWGREGSEGDYIDHRLDCLSDWLNALPA